MRKSGVYNQPIIDPPLFSMLCMLAIWQRNTDFVTVAFICGLVTVGLLIACGTSWERIHNPLPPVPLVKHIPTNTPPSVKILFQE